MPDPKPPLPPSFTQGTRPHFFGSLLRYSHGSWCVPYLFWLGTRWYRNASWLGGIWNALDRVVLVPRIAVSA